MGIYTGGFNMKKDTIACNSRYLLVVYIGHSHHLFIICTKTRIFLAILQGNLQLYYFFCNKPGNF